VKTAALFGFGGGSSSASDDTTYVLKGSKNIKITDTVVSP
jgi:hypothetical protein